MSESITCRDGHSAPSESIRPDWGSASNPGRHHPLDPHYTAVSPLAIRGAGGPDLAHGQTAVAGRNAAMGSQNAQTPALEQAGQLPGKQAVLGSSRRSQHDRFQAPATRRATCHDSPPVSHGSKRPALPPALRAAAGSRPATAASQRGAATYSFSPSPGSSTESPEKHQRNPVLPALPGLRISWPTQPHRQIGGRYQAAMPRRRTVSLRWW